jgi:hypothetical protein
MPRNGPRYSEQEARAAVAASRSYAEALRALGMRPAGGNHATLRRYVEQIWRIPHDDFDPHAAKREAMALRTRARPLSDVLVRHSTYSRGSLKTRLYREGLKQPICELCGQGEIWRGRRMSLILDHINGVADDHRLENLQIVCPNCAATLETHCGKQNRRLRSCESCGEEFAPKRREQRFCTQRCAYDREVGVAKPEQRRVARPPYNHLIREIHALGWSGVGRRYGVSDNAVRKWVRQYERERAREGDHERAEGTERAA